MSTTFERSNLSSWGQRLRSRTASGLRKIEKSAAVVKLRVWGVGLWSSGFQDQGKIL